MPFAIKTVGGPLDGQTRMVDTLDQLRSYGLDWPPPETLKVPPEAGNQGQYKRVSFSELPVEAAQHPNVGVGAEYHWEEIK